MSKIEKNTHIKIAIKLTKTNISNKAMKIKAYEPKRKWKKNKNGKKTHIKIAIKLTKTNVSNKATKMKIKAMKHTKRDT